MNGAPSGSLHIHRLPSDILRSNPLGDPSERDLHVYLPPGYDKSKKYPALLGLVGFLGIGASYFNSDPLAENLKQRLDRLISSGKCPPIIVAAPDCFTRFGGNQYINSSATGRYEDYLISEVLPFVEQHYPVSRWGVFGKSSGGYGATVLGMRHADIFQAFANHSGDTNFELCYLHEFGEALDRFREAGGPAKWLQAYWASDNRHKKVHMRALNILAMAAHYSPNPSSQHLGIDFPFDLETGEFRWEIWQKWREHDPVNMAGKYADNLKKLRFIYVDCGTRDEWNLHWGARALIQKLRGQGLSPHYEEFDDGHMFITYRYDISLPLLAKALSE